VFALHGQPAEVLVTNIAERGLEIQEAVEHEINA
jgi:hypothetical protein